MSFSVRQLAPLYEQHGIGLRKNVGQFPGWTKRAKTVVDLDEDERELLEREGEPGLREFLRERSMFAFPALDIYGLKPLHLRTCLGARDKLTARIYAPESGHLRRAAEALRESIAQQGCQPPELCSADEFTMQHLSEAHAIVLGGAHESRAAAELCDRYYCDADLRFPGPGGWLVRTVHNPANLGHNVLHVCGANEALDAARGVLEDAMMVSAGGQVEVGQLAEIHPGPNLLEKLGDFDDWRPRLAALAGQRRDYEVRTLESDERFAQWLAAAYDSGGPKKDLYNRGPMQVGSMSARLYMLTGDRRFLWLYKEMLWRLIEYCCNLPGGASYISDYDFGVYSQVIYWDLLEEDPIFSDAERLIITNFLLASVRMCDGYGRTNWPIEPGQHRHNHETFGALTMHFGGRYFAEYYDLPEAQSYLDAAQLTFTGPIGTSFKHLEDANLYQWIVPAHKVMYDIANGNNGYVDNGCLARVVENIIITTDNLGYPCDFGDAGRPISGGTLPGALLEVAAGRYQDQGVQGHADRILESIPGSTSVPLPGSVCEFFGPKRIEGRTPQAQIALAKMPLDDHVRADHSPSMPRHYVYDKIALRDGDTPSGQYLLLDGYSAGSHCHYDQNAVIRFTQGERIWIVDNGYGKPTGVKRAGVAFSQREIGPQDHNTLLVYTSGSELAEPPPFCALLTELQRGPLSLVQSCLLGYGGTDWLRNVVMLRGKFFLVIDQVSVQEQVHELRCQFNMLGEVDLSDGLLVCDQTGARMFMHFEPGADTELGSYGNQSWTHELEAGHYQFAELPVKKLDRIQRPQPGAITQFATLFYAGQLEQPLFETQVLAEEVIIKGDLGVRDECLEVEGLTIRLSGDEMRVAYQSPWPIPNDLPR